jgi:hypothetical protein
VDAAHDAYLALIGLVIEAQRAGSLPTAAEPERLTALLRATVQGAADLAISGHLARDGKGRAAPEGVIDDLLASLKP